MLVKGTTLKCSRCNWTRNVYPDIQVNCAWMCPNCNKMNGILFNKSVCFNYETGNEPSQLNDTEEFLAEWDMLRGNEELVNNE